MPEEDRILLEDVRLSFPDIWKPKAAKEGDDAKFGAAFLLHKELHKDLIVLIKSAIVAVASEEFKDKTLTMLKEKRIKLCLHQASEKTYDGYDDDHQYLSTSSKTRPSVINRDHSPLIESDGRPYAGCYVNAAVRLWLQNNKYAIRVNCELLGVQFVRDGDPFGKPPFDPTEFFPKIEPRKDEGSPQAGERDGRSIDF